MDASSTSPNSFTRCNRYTVIGCKLFAVINAITMGGFVVFSIYTAIMKLELPDSKLYFIKFFGWFNNALVIIFLVGTIIAFIFAMILYVGILKRNPVLLKAYVVYGILVDTLSVSGTIGFIFLFWTDKVIIVRVPPVVFGLCFVHALLLWLVSRTAALFTSANQYSPSARDTELADAYNQKCYYDPNPILNAPILHSSSKEFY